MKRSLLLSAIFLFIFAVSSRSLPAQILVDATKTHCSTAQFTTIQSAVNAASPGESIHVCPGTYPEQVTITKSLVLRADNGVVVIPSGVSANATDISSGESIAAIFFVQNAEVDLGGFIVDGSNNGILECSPRFIGILYQNASGQVAHNAVRHIALPPFPNGCQSGNAIEVQTASGLSSNVTIAENSVWDYQKNGITANDAGSETNIDGNVVTGFGSTTGAAENGIQIGFGATGRVVGNTIADNVYSPCVSPTNCAFNATGILIFESNDVLVGNNSLATNQVGIFIGGDNSTIGANWISNSVTLIGIALAGNGNLAARNMLTHADQAAIFIQGNSNSVADNTITDASIGILKISGSTGNAIAGNTFFADGATIVDPAPSADIHVQPSH